jgi:hypothetical protein
VALIFDEDEFPTIANTFAVLLGSTNSLIRGAKEIRSVLYQSNLIATCDESTDIQSPTTITTTSTTTPPMSTTTIVPVRVVIPKSRPPSATKSAGQ